eukprot:4091877-Amphidinium_carterae.1
MPLKDKWKKTQNIMWHKHHKPSLLGLASRLSCLCLLLLAGTAGGPGAQDRSNPRFLDLQVPAPTNSDWKAGME